LPSRMLEGAAQPKPKLGADSLWSRAPRPELLPRAQAKMRAVQRSLDLVVLDAEGLAAALMFQFESWDKKTFYPTGVGGPTSNGRTLQTIVTTKEEFVAAHQIYAPQLSELGYHCRSALSYGEGYEATDIIVSTDSGFSKSFPKMVFHIWGKYT
jgi:hypothetical protein